MRLCACWSPCGSPLGFHTIVRATESGKANIKRCKRPGKKGVAKQAVPTKASDTLNHIEKERAPGAPNAAPEVLRAPPRATKIRNINFHSFEYDFGSNM